MMADNDMTPIMAITRIADTLGVTIDELVGVKQ